MNLPASTRFCLLSNPRQSGSAYLLLATRHPQVRERLRRIVEQSDSPKGRAFDIAVQCVIGFSLVCFSIETLPDLSYRSRSLLHTIELATVAFFSTEYLLRLSVAKRPMRYASSFFGIVDLLSVLPFYLSGAADLRVIRAFRLLRLFRIFKLARYNQAVQRFHRALLIAWEELMLFFALAAIILFLSACGIYHFEHEQQPEKFASIFHSLWWAVATLTTVGYGDVFPVTTGGRVFTFFVLLVGLGIVSVPAGLVASALSEARRMEASETSEP